MESHVEGLGAADSLLEVRREGAAGGSRESEAWRRAAGSALLCRTERYHRVRASPTCRMAPKIGARTKTTTATSTPASIGFPEKKIGAFSQRFCCAIVAN